MLLTSENEDITLPSYLEECQIENSKRDCEAGNSCFEQGNDYKPRSKEAMIIKSQVSSTERHTKKRKKTKNSRKLEKMIKQSLKEQEDNKILSDIEYEMKKYGFEESIKPINTQNTLRETNVKRVNSPRTDDEYSVTEKKKYTRNNSHLYL